MKINLKNVKQHKSFYMELPDKGMVLLRGRSGAGKSSILSAIVESLYSSVGNLTHWDESKSSIELDFLGLNIVKTHGPKSLNVKYDGKCFTDEEAQWVLNKRLGMSEKEFMASSYVEQDAKNSLLTLGPAEQLRFIQ